MEAGARRSWRPKALVGQRVARDEELVRLRRELARLKKERDFLPSAVTYFAGTEKGGTGG